MCRSTISDLIDSHAAVNRILIVFDHETLQSAMFIVELELEPVVSKSRDPDVKDRCVVFFKPDIDCKSAHCQMCSDL